VSVVTAAAIMTAVTAMSVAALIAAAAAMSVAAAIMTAVTVAVAVVALTVAVMTPMVIGVVQAVVAVATMMGARAVVAMPAMAGGGTRALARSGRRRAESARRSSLRAPGEQGKRPGRRPRPDRDRGRHRTDRSANAAGVPHDESELRGFDHQRASGGKQRPVFRVVHPPRADLRPRDEEHGKGDEERARNDDGPALQGSDRRPVTTVAVPLIAVRCHRAPTRAPARVRSRHHRVYGRPLSPAIPDLDDCSDRKA
jgi:hypothetical protein